MRYTKPFTRQNWDGNKKVIVYGAGRYGEIAKATLDALGIPIFAFADRALAGAEYKGIPCIHPEQLEGYKEDIVILASLNYFAEICKYCRSIGMKNIYDMEWLLSVEVSEDSVSEYALDDKRTPLKYKRAVENVSYDELVMDRVDLVVTERCSLRCRDCCNLMQYYDKPEDLDYDGIIASFDRLLDVADRIVEVRILGGEPFLYKRLGELLERYLNNEKILSFAFFTNSTIVPQDAILKAMRSDKVRIHMSDYGALSRKVGQLAEKLEENGIGYYIHNYQNWYDVGSCERRNYTLEQSKKVFSQCIVGNCITLYRGRLYRCPRAAHGERLGFFKGAENETVDFTEEIDDIAAYRKKLDDFLHRTEYVTACFYCDGFNNRSKEVPAAVQMRG